MSQLNFNKISEVREKLLHHPIYKEMNDSNKIKTLMSHHVFAVWDFMSLLKRLQQDLTCVTVPWTPAKNAQYGRFINEIVIEEETDSDGEGGYISHFELYLKAMDEVNADTTPITTFITRIKAGEQVSDALNNLSLPASVKNFVNFSISIAMNGKPHEVAAAFFFGREDLIPDMFQLLLDELKSRGENAKWMQYYLSHHIELDGDDHGPLAEKLLYSLCEDDPEKLKEAEEIAIGALQSRIELWDGVIEQLNNN
ncbi:antimetabolite toxin biosynthesis protein MgoB [Lottiidibacillus patelloidae]|uniref:Antimetabolite toxin biosynthesis protein MgoB n=1 Tax=Lottiidibacillus patelloidae TaxID=2670334 RepID=A0A263BV33_9BACI|nr:DUF3050 domain-containing protein [Lottiidibacillus patelloidae]OZM57613.1 antimetabolite toxin biosynthesis protein MgoB [Lottiidibacillus patelloidae]